MTELPGKTDMSSFRVTVDLCKASGTKLAHFQTILCYSEPIYVWSYENGAKEFHPYHSYFTLIPLGHPKTQTMQTADCRLQTVQTADRADYADCADRADWLLFSNTWLTFLVLLLPNRIQYVPMLLNTKRKILKMLLKPKNLKSNVNFSMRWITHYHRVYYLSASRTN